MTYKYYSMIGLSKNAYENLFYIKSTLEAQLKKQISFSRLIFILSFFIGKEIENDNFEKKLIETAKCLLEGGKENGKNVK